MIKAGSWQNPQQHYSIRERERERDKGRVVKKGKENNAA